MNASNTYTLNRLESCLAAGYENRKLRRATAALLRHVRRRPALAQAVIEHEQDRFPLTCAALSGRPVKTSAQISAIAKRVEKGPIYQSLWRRLQVLVLGALTRKPANER